MGGRVGSRGALRIREMCEIADVVEAILRGCIGFKHSTLPFIRECSP